MALGQRRVQPVAAAVRIAVQLADAARERLLGGRERAERAFVRRELDDALEPELALDVLDRLPGLIRRQGANAGAEEGVAGTARAAAVGACCHRADPSERPRLRAQHTSAPASAARSQGQSLGPGRVSPVPAGLRRLQAMAELGLFPLPLVLVPTERIPLHIFEPRYLELIEECVATGGDFGFVLATGDGAVHEVGTRASVQRVLEALDDGTMNVVVEGGERFRLLELTKGRLVHDRHRRAGGRSRRARGRPGPDPRAPSSSHNSPTSPRATSTCRTSTRRSSSSSSRRASTSGSTRSRSCSRRPRRRARVKRLNELLEIAIEAVRLEHTLRERAGQNGKVSPLETDL